MLVCPQCQFDNPDTNKFCQQCGISLTHKLCPECGTQVPYSARKCQNCGTFTGTVWWAIISGQVSSAPITAAPEETPAPMNVDLLEATDPAAESGKPAPIQVSWNDDPQVASTPEKSEPLPVTYLDSQQRYQLLEQPVSLHRESNSPQTPNEMQVRVLDCQPLQASPLEFLLLQQQRTGAVGDEALSSGATIPALAEPYLALEQHLYSALPKVHDAWSAGGVEVILLENRSNWPLLLNLWRDEEIPYLQLLHLLHEMAGWWEALEPLNCRQSLLELTNLRVDEDQAIGMQRLYSDPPGINLTLQALGTAWQELFHQSERTLFGPIAMLLYSLQTDTIQTVDELRSRLEAIAQEFQPDSTQATPMIPFDPDFNSGAVPPSTPTVSSELTASEYRTAAADGDDTPTVVLPMQLLSLEDAGRTDVGRQRRHNEDYFGIQTSLTKVESPLGRTVQARGLYILCDGMGGHAGGEVASALAVKTLSTYFQQHWTDDLPDEACIREGIRQANQAIYDVNQQDARSGSGRMGTTLVMLLVQDTQVAAAHVGDSRLYRFSRRQALEQVTTDHEVGQREIKRGVEAAIAYSRPDAYQLTQALGPRNEHFVVPDVQFFELNEDTLLLLCSDGLSDNDLIENHWSTHLKPLISSRSNLEQGVSELIELANQYNGHDNITAILIRAKVRPDLDQARAVSS